MFIGHIDMPLALAIDALLVFLVFCGRIARTLQNDLG
jgi:hypothetical protein